MDWLMRNSTTRFIVFLALCSLPTISTGNDVTDYLIGGIWGVFLLALLAKESPGPNGEYYVD